MLHNKNKKLSDMLPMYKNKFTNLINAMKKILPALYVLNFVVGGINIYINLRIMTRLNQLILRNRLGSVTIC